MKRVFKSRINVLLALINYLTPIGRCAPPDNAQTPIMFMFASFDGSDTLVIVVVLVIANVALETKD